VSEHHAVRQNDGLSGIGKLMHWRMFGVLASVGIGILASSLTACQNANDNTTNLALLEWNGYQHVQYHPEYNAKYDRQPTYTFFANAQDARLVEIRIDFIECVPVPNRVGG
jgi:hypothetical protein